MTSLALAKRQPVSSRLPSVLLLTISVVALTVVKIAPRHFIAEELQCFQRVEVWLSLNMISAVHTLPLSQEVLGNNAPSVRGFVELGDKVRSSLLQTV